MNEFSKQLVLHLSLIKGVGPSLCKRLHEILGQRFAQLYQINAGDLISRGLSPASAELVINGLKDKEVLAKELELIERHKISWLTMFDSEYPSLLKEIHLPPTIIYFRGKLPENDSLAIVGSRAANSYGQKVIESIVPELVANQFVIVSGGAVGVDAMAHQAALNARGTTIVVLGSGLLRPYPARNERLFNQVVDAGGVLMSSFALETTPVPGNFPARNRIIAGISRGCIVVQAAQESGAKITALFALEQGREVFAVPGPIDDPLSEGCHSLIGQGAKLVHSVRDILTEFNIDNSQPLLKTNVAQQTTINFEQKSEHAIIDDAKQPLAQRIIIRCAQPQSVDKLVEDLELDLASLQAAIFDLQMCGMIEQNTMGLWQKV